ncbi:hypothetical protein [Pseudoalteromonas sp. PPB1]|uniref:hypothetical protein n=1 Tax=Pseudoalteromonas sp. PPB1 TaxID=2756136 RepID=UPI0018912F76|nr:hypothetical protein [Pseudoalteromonas sp. PPB1]
MRKLISLFVLLNALTLCASAHANPCKTVSGTLSVWNGHPPSLRLSDTSDGNLYGVEEAGEGPRKEALPPGLYERFLSGENHVIGTFCLEILEDKYSLVYDSSEIRLVRIRLYSE